MKVVGQLREELINQINSGRPKNVRAVLDQQYECCCEEAPECDFEFKGLTAEQEPEDDFSP